MVSRRHGRYDVLVIGGGVTGLTAAHHAARSGLSTALIEGEPLFGGQIATVEQLDGYPAVGALSGIDLAVDLVERCRSLGVAFHQAPIESLAVGGGGLVGLAAGERHRARAVVVASGARLKRLGVPGEDTLLGKGVSQCAWCDGHLYRGEDVAVVGGGDAAAQEALVLAGLCRRVYVVARSPLRAKPDYVNRLSRLDNVEFVWSSVVDEVLGSGAVEGVRLRGVRDGGVRELACEAVFPFIGSIPNSEFLPAEVACEDGYVLTDAEYASSLPGVFAAGAVRRGYGGHVAEAVGEAVSAASAAARYLRAG
ncbi:MAG: FAD-dependent oxidoreductase [Chloroflexi bacterium]|nr:FAD-dependent oxidoreductase [Chloroflexota bacterium]